VLGMKRWGRELFSRSKTVERGSALHYRDELATSVVYRMRFGEWGEAVNAGEIVQAAEEARFARVGETKPRPQNGEFEGTRQPRTSTRTAHQSEVAGLHKVHTPRQWFKPRSA